MIGSAYKRHEKHTTKTIESGSSTRKTTEREKLTREISRLVISHDFQDLFRKANVVQFADLADRASCSPSLRALFFFSLKLKITTHVLRRINCNLVLDGLSISRQIGLLLKVQYTAS